MLAIRTMPGLLMACTLLTTVLSYGLYPGATKEDWLSVARCRSHCLQQSVTIKAGKSSCSKDPACYECWLMCEDLTFTPAARGPLCGVTNTQDTGCRTACDFIQHQQPDIRESDAFQFPTTPIVQVKDTSGVNIRWFSPVSQDVTLEATRPEPVFVVFRRNSAQEAWTMLRMTSALRARVTGLSGANNDFLLVAVTADGLKTEATPEVVKSTEESPMHQDFYLTTPSYETLDTTTEADDLTTSAAQEIPEFSLSIGQVSGHVTVEVSWEQSTEYESWVLLWGRESCRDVDNVPCDLKQEQFVTAVRTPGEQVTHTIHHVTYNSYYWIELRRYDDVTTGRRMVFQTPVCENVDASSTHCYPVTTKVSSPVVTTPNTVSIDPNQEFKLKWAEHRIEQLTEALYAVCGFVLVFGALMIVLFVFDVRKLRNKLTKGNDRKLDHKSARPRIYIGPKEDELAKGMAQMVLNNLNLHTPRLNTTVDSITKVNLSDSDNTFGSLFNLNHTVLDTCEKTYRRYSIVDLPDEENVTSPCLSPKAKYNIGDISV